ncbi:hypothetical protein [Streptomyces sp. 1222.5]|uniref:hypothetical protein n=1 Tax=Streptomyces sp. 1222.5 TaxID=1881026 RepID=UPI003D726E0B
MRQPPPASPVLLGEPLLVGEVLVLPEGLAEGLVEGLVEGAAVRGGELGRRLLLEARGLGVAFAGEDAGAVARAEGREVGTVPRVAGSGRRTSSPRLSRTPFRAGCVLARSGEACSSGTRTPGSSVDGWSGIEAARGAVDWEKTVAVPSPPRRVKAAAASDRKAYFFRSA